MVWVAKSRPPPGLSRISRAMAIGPRAQPKISSPGCVSRGFGLLTSTPMTRLFFRKRREGVARQAIHSPLRVRFRTESRVEADGVLVPVEHRPLHPSAPAVDRDLGQAMQQGASYPTAAMLRVHEEIFEVEARLAEERREVVKEEGKSKRLPLILGDQGLGVVALAEKEIGELLFGHRHLVLELFVARQGANEVGDERHVCKLPRSNGERHRFGRSFSRYTNRIAPCVSEKLAILLSTRPAARPAAMRSVSRRSLRPPFGRMTQIAPFGSIQVLTSFRPSRSRLSVAAMNTRSQRVRGRPWTMSVVRCRSSFTKEASSMSTSATLAPGLTPSLSRSGLVVSATDGPEHDDTQEPAGVCARYGESDQGDRVADPTRQQAAQPDHGGKNDGAGDSAGQDTDQGGGAPRVQTSITCRSLTAPVTVPE